MKHIHLLVLCGLLSVPLSSAVAQSEIAGRFAFEAGSFRLNATHKEDLEEVAARMKQNPTWSAQITGYSKPGETTPNGRVIDGLGEARANAVKSYLVTRFGIDPARIATSGATSPDSQSALLVFNEK
jgi:outer membrane protein OmpA-like peptidoglycan-associated protein